MFSQLVLGVGCVLLLLVGVRSGKSSSLILAAALVVVTVIATMITLRHGILIPWLPQMVTALAILGISFRQHSRKPTGGSLESLK